MQSTTSAPPSTTTSQQPSTYSPSTPADTPSTPVPEETTTLPTQEATPGSYPGPSTIEQGVPVVPGTDSTSTVKAPSQSEQGKREVGRM